MKRSRSAVEMPRRMRAYAALAEERYRLPTYPVATVTVVDRYDSTFLGIQAHQDYRVNLWEVDVNLVFEQPLPALLPFVPMLQGGKDATVVRQALQMLRRDEQFNQLESLLAFFASFVLDTALVQQIMRWDMAVLRESPWYQEILQEGEARITAR